MCEVENEDAVGAAPTILFPTKVRLKLKVLRYFMIAHFFIPVVTKPNGVPCAFPFFYNGQSYTSCTQDGDRGDAWCATVNQLADDSDLWDPCYLICELYKYVHRFRIDTVLLQRASYQTCKIVDCACVGNSGNVFPTTDFKGNR